MADLVAFSVTDDYFAVRQQLGLVAANSSGIAMTQEAAVCVDAMHSGACISRPARSAGP